MGNVRIVLFASVNTVRDGDTGASGHASSSISNALRGEGLSAGLTDANGI